MLNKLMILIPMNTLILILVTNTYSSISLVKTFFLFGHFNFKFMTNSQKIMIITAN